MQPYTRHLRTRQPTGHGVAGVFCFYALLATAGSTLSLQTCVELEHSLQIQRQQLSPYKVFLSELLGSEDNVALSIAIKGERRVEVDAVLVRRAYAVRTSKAKALELFVPSRLPGRKSTSAVELVASIATNDRNLPSAVDSLCKSAAYHHHPELFQSETSP